MTAHTPGPWIVVHELRQQDEVVCDCVNKTWVIPARGQRLGNWVSDATLISAAPEMLAALYEVEKYLVEREDVIDGDYGQPAPNAEMTLLIEVRAAIANARGAK